MNVGINIYLLVFWFLFVAVLRGQSQKIISLYKDDGNGYELSMVNDSLLKYMGPAQFGKTGVKRNDRIECLYSLEKKGEEYVAVSVLKNTQLPLRVYFAGKKRWRPENDEDCQHVLFGISGDYRVMILNGKDTIEPSYFMCEGTYFDHPLKKGDVIQFYNKHNHIFTEKKVMPGTNSQCSVTAPVLWDILYRYNYNDSALLGATLKINGEQLSISKENKSVELKLSSRKEYFNQMDFLAEMSYFGFLMPWTTYDKLRKYRRTRGSE